MAQSVNELTPSELKGSILRTDAVLKVGDYLVSPGGLYFLVMQGDGNLCVYRGSGPKDNQGFVWGSVQAGGYQPRLSEYYTIMQGDGNLCVYTGQAPGSGGTFLFGTVQQGHYQPQSGQYFTVIQDDGNFCVYRSSVPSGLVWAAGPAHK